MRREVLAIDLAVAVALAALVLIISPGVAVAGMLALLVLLGCALSVVWDVRRGGRGRSSGNRRPGQRRPTRSSGSGGPPRPPRQNRPRDR